MLYLDTSVLVSAYTHEPATARALAFLNRQTDPVSISEWVATEFAAALSMKMRIGALEEAYRREALALFERSAAASMEMIPVATSHFKAAARFATEYKLGLRAADALHLAIAAERDATLCTLDKRLAKAGKALGVATKLI